MNLIVHKKNGFSLIELIVVIAILAIVASIIITHTYDLVAYSRNASQNHGIAVWNETYQQACAANPNILLVTDWSTISNDLAAGVTANVGNQAVTFACPKPQFINADKDPTFVPGKGITAAP